MKLSKAIREGAKLRPQCHGSYFKRNGELASCAIGAAVEIVTGEAEPGYLLPEAFWNAFPELTARKDYHIPGTNVYCDQLRLAIVELNDKCFWTREQIADWVERQGY